MHVDIVYEKNKVLQALRYHFITRPDIKTLAIIIIMFSLVAGVFLFLRKIQPQIFLLASIIWLAYFIIVFYILPLLIYYKSKSVFKDRFTGYFTNSYLSIENERGRTEWQWDKFSNFFETDNFYHLYFNKRAFFLIPKKYIEPEKKKEITRLLVKNVRIGKY